MNATELDRIFTYHPPRPGQPQLYQEIRARARVLADLVVYACPDVRERAVAITKIEEAVMWANAAIGRGD